MIEFDPLSEAVFADPYPFYRRLRDESPVHYSEQYNCWFLSRFSDIWREEQDHASYTIVDGQMPMQLLSNPELEEMIESIDRGELGESIAALDPPRHTQVRSILAPHFKPTAAKALEDRTRELVRGFISEWVDRGECDVIGDYAMRTSVRIACIVSGLPLDMADWFVERVNSMFERDETDQGFSLRAMTLVGELHAWLEEFITERRRKPTDAPDAINALFNSRPNGKPLSDKDVSANVSLMLIGGTETLPKAFSAGVYRLYQNPDQRAEIVKDPSLVTAAFREVLRYDMPTQALGRTVRIEKDVRGQKLRPGQGVLFLWASANHDAREFPDPDRCAIHRRAPRGLTFGSGAHMCLGAHVAQMEGRVMLEELLAVAPEYEVLEDRATWIRSEVFRGFSSLPIRFNPPR